MTFLDFLAALPWWLHLLAGIGVGSFAMYGPAYKVGLLDGVATANGDKVSYE